MAVYDPNFEIELSAQLNRRAGSAEAIRAALVLPGQIRAHGARIAMFIGAAMLAQDGAMKADAMGGLARAIRGFDAVRDLFADWRRRDGLHPDLAPLFVAMRARDSGAIKAIDAYRAVVGAAYEEIARKGDIDPAIFDEVMRVAYATFHPAMLGLSQRMSEAGQAARNRADQSAREAQARALDARERIDTIARTVRLISLNARVEAAHAGDAGRAFGVIAEEIKALSEQTEAVSAELGDSVDDIMAALRTV